MPVNTKFAIMKLRHLVLILAFIFPLLLKAQIGTFEFNLIGDSTAVGEAGETIFAYGELINNSPFDVELLLIKVVNDMPEGWTSAICTDVCAAPTVDTAFQILQAGQTQSFTMYFYTSDTPETAFTLMKFLNLQVPTNVYTQGYFGQTSPFTAITDLNHPESVLSNIYPVPADDILTFELHPERVQEFSEMEIAFTGMDGRTLLRSKFEWSSQISVPVANLPSGVHTYTITNNSDFIQTGKFVVK